MSAAAANWQIVPYEGEAMPKRVRVRDEGRIRDVLRYLHAHECVALIGPPFSEKSKLLHDVSTALRETGRYLPLYLDLWQTSSQDESTFFESMVTLIQQALGNPSTHPAEHAQNARAFQNYLSACADSQTAHLVLLIDHLQALPHDLVHSLLLALRAAYMERSLDAERQLVAVVSGGMNLVGLSAGATSPFNIAKPVLASALTAEQSRALAEATLRANNCAVSHGALTRIVEWASGDRYLVPQLSAWAVEMINGYRRNVVDRRVVDRAAQRLLLSDKGQAPIREAIRMIEEDPDTLLDVLHLLQQGELARSRARQMPTRTGADRLQLSGAVILVDGCYTIKNLAYREALTKHFTTDRVGHILRIAGRWQEAIAYLAPQLSSAQGGDAQAQLLEATVQSIYATDSLGRCWELLARGLEQGFGLTDVTIYQAIPAQAAMQQVYPREENLAPARVISLHDPDSVEARTFEYGNYAVRGSANQARLIVALTSTRGRRIGTVTIERYIQGRDPHELPSQLPVLLHFLGHAASAVENVQTRAAYREIGQAVLNASTLQPTLHRVLDVVSLALGCEAANLYLLDSGQETVEMVAGVGQWWNPEWQALARFSRSSEHPAAAVLRDSRMKVTPGADERLNRSITHRFGLQKLTWLYLPLQAAGQPLGTLELGYSETFKLTPGEENRANLAAFANQVAIAVHNMQLLRRTDAALARRVDELERLRSSSLAISAILDVPTVLARILRDLKSLFPGSETTIWEYDRSTSQLMVLQSSLSDGEYLQQRLNADSVAGRAITTGQVQIVTDLKALPEAPDDPAVRLGLQGLIAVPLVSHNRTLGAINLYSYAGQPQAIQAAEAELLQAFAAHAAVAIDTARLHEEELKQQRLEQELEVAQEIQRSLLPAAWPETPGWEFAATYKAARTIGGDFYDFCPLPSEPARLGVVIADVTDKGVPAALFMALSRTIIRTMALSGRGPAAVLMRANEMIIRDSQSDVYLTALYGVFDLAAGRLIYANAGHNRPLHYQSQHGTVSQLTASGILLGAFDGIQLEEQRVNLRPGDVIVLYTDGITDAMNHDGEMYGDERLTSVLVDHARQSAENILHALLDAVASFAHDTEQADDITCVVIKKL